MNLKNRLGLLLTILAVTIPAAFWYFELTYNILVCSLLILVLASVSAILTYKGAATERRWYLGMLIFVCDCGLVLFSFSLLGVEPGSRISANESRAAATLHCLATMNVAFENRNNRYVTKLEELAGSQAQQNTCLPAETEEVIKKGTVKGYIFKYLIVPGTGFQITAAPERPAKTGTKFFYVDQHLKVHYAATQPATSDSPEIGD